MLQIPKLHEIPFMQKWYNFADKSDLVQGKGYIFLGIVLAIIGLIVVSLVGCLLFKFIGKVINASKIFKNDYPKFSKFRKAVRKVIRRK